MIIDFSQKVNNIELSYVSDEGSIDVEKIFMEPDSVTNGIYEIVTTSDDDIDKIPDLKSYKGNSVKKVPAKYFKDFNKNEYLCQTLKDQNPQLYEKIHKLVIPKMYSFDIETEITDEFGYSTPEKAENRVLSISVTNENLASILFIVKNDSCNVEDFGNKNIEQYLYIENIVRTSLQNNYNENIKFDIHVFETETEMLQTFISCINNYFHVLFGWNCFAYDWTYIYNRCLKLGIDVKKASPTNRMAKPKVSINKALNIPCEYPQHRLLLDYMNIFKASLIYSNLDSYSLDSISSQILGIKKVTYEGNLNTLYHSDYLRFIAYAFVDTLLPMLIHKNSQLVTTLYFQSIYNKLPFLELNQNPISSSLIYSELRRQGKFMTSNEFIKKEWRPYLGAFVKDITKHRSSAMLGLDFSSLYPNSIISYFLSFDTKIDDTILMKDGKPENEFNKIKFEEYKKNGYCITPLGNIYEANPDNIFSNIETNLLAERKLYKGAKSQIYLEILPKIEKMIQQLKNHTNKNLKNIKHINKSFKIKNV